MTEPPRSEDRGRVSFSYSNARLTCPSSFSSWHEHCIQRPRLRRIAQRRSGQASKLKRQSTASIAYGTWRPPGNESDPQTSASEATDRVEDSSSMKAMLYSRIDMIMTANYDDLLVVTNFLVVVVSAAR